MDFTGDDGLPQRTTGVIGALGSRPRAAASVMPHERTLPKAKSDRLELLRATRANLDPIWGLSLATGLSTLLAQAHADLADAPFATATDEDGFHHSLWRITDPERIEAIRAAVAGARLVLADGHHRFETASNYRAERRAAGVDDPGADGIMTLVVELAPEQLCVRAIHRLLDRRRRRRPARRARPARSGSHAAGANVPEGVAALEVAMRDERRARPRRPRRAGAAAPGPRSSRPAWTTFPRSCVTSTRPASTPACSPPCPGCRSPTATTRVAVAAQVEKGDADAAVLLRPVTVDTIRAAAAADLRMPEKTTFFAPEAAHRDGVPQPRPDSTAVSVSR